MYKIPDLLMFLLVFGCECWLGVRGLAPLELNVTEYEVSLLLRTIELAVRRVQLLVQVEQLNLVFGLFGLATFLYLPKKVLQGQNQKEKAITFR